MVEKEIIVTRVEVDWNACLQNRGYQRVCGWCDHFQRQSVEDCTVTVRERLVGRVDGFAHAWQAEILDKGGCAGDVSTIVLYAIDAETGGLLVHYGPEP